MLYIQDFDRMIQCQKDKTTGEFVEIVGGNAV